MSDAKSRLKEKTLVVALGGNALGIDPFDQNKTINEVVPYLIDVLVPGMRMLVTHGNGPQVGMINSAFFFASKNPENDVYVMPLPECGAMSQGYIGYQLSQAFISEFRRRGMKTNCVNMMTQTVVSEKDPAFSTPPNKPVGAFMTEEAARAYAAETGFFVGPDSGRGWRRMVSSPLPQSLLEAPAAKELLEEGYLVIAGGGGGVPVAKQPDGTYKGVDAVVDKDRTSAQLALDVGADMLVILTAVEKVYLNFGKPNQKGLDSLTLEEAKKYIDEGQFGEGSMLPKVEACMHFVNGRPGSMALITSIENAKDAVHGEGGTRIIS